MNALGRPTGGSHLGRRGSPQLSVLLLVVWGSLGWSGLHAQPEADPATQPVVQPAATQPGAATVSGKTGIRPASEGYEQAVVFPVRREITEITYESLKRRLRSAKESDVRLVIIELDTPGGALNATLDICTMLKEHRDDGMSIWAWVNKSAYSAGTIIALACDGIVMSRNARMGDCQPIMVTGAGASAIPEDIEAKATSPLLSELRDSARRNDYPLELVLALIRPEIQIFWLENSETGERRFVDLNGRNRLFGLPPARRDAERSRKDDSDREETRRELETVEPIPDSMSRTTWRYVTSAPGLRRVTQPIDSDRELLTMHTDEATAYGFCVATINNDTDLRAFFNITGPIQRMERTWTEAVIEWLASPMVRGVLFLLMILGAYTEFQSPGFGLPGIVALVALILFLGAPYLAGYTVTWELLLILAGVALLLVELFVLPGFGVPGIIGIVFIMIGIIASFVPAEPTFDPGWFRMPSMRLTYDYLLKGLFSVAGGLVGAMVGMFLLAKYFPRIPVGSRLITPNPEAALLALDDPYAGVARVGDVGRTETLLRPAGKARFGDVLVDVVSQGEYIEAGQAVVVIEHIGNRVVVRRAQ